MDRKSIQPPSDKQVYEGDIATYWIDDGILVSVSKSIKRTVSNIGDNVKLVKEITGGKKMPLLIWLSPSPVPDKATRKFSTIQLPVIYSAMAMISEPGLSAFIMKILFALKPPPIPMKSFTGETPARAWLQQFKLQE